jgi:RimJ/RimL family protein N-acetyltransferase
MAVELTRPTCRVRSWKTADVDSIAKYANNHKIWLNLRDAFPHPYEKRHAREFIRSTLRRVPETNFAIAVGGEAVGGIGFSIRPDVERISAEVGYWLGEPFWGRGIATDALVAVSEHAIRAHGLRRLFAVPFEWNAASCRVLEKAGYVLEARLRCSCIKNGQVVDQLQYALIVDPPPGGRRG